EAPRHHEDSTVEGTAASRLGYRETLRVAAGAVRGDHGLLLALAFQICLMAAFEADILLLQPYLDARGVPLAWFGVLQVPPRLGFILGSMVSARVARVAGVLTLAATTLVLAVGGLGTLAIVDHPAAFGGFIAVQMAMGLVVPGINGYVNDRTASSIRATVM